MKKDRCQPIPFDQQIIQLKQSYLLGKYQELIIHDQYMYPPIEKDIREIFVSQFGQSLLDQYIRNYSEQKMDRKNKFPLPIIFAFIHHHLKANKYQNLIRIILQHADRKSVQHYYIIMYNIAKIYQKFQEYKKSIFYLENLLKEEPFFQHAIYDLCYHYAIRFQREQEACNILERHINHSLSSDKYIHSLYLYICSKFKVRNVKDVAKLLHNKPMNLVTYFNLGLYLRQNDELDKAEEIFTQIIAKLSKAKVQKLPHYSAKDDKLLLLSKINLFLIMQQQTLEQKKSLELVESFSKSIINEFKELLDAQTLSKLSPKQFTHQISSFQSPKGNRSARNFYSTRRFNQHSSGYKPQRTENGQNPTQNKQNFQKLNSFNHQFTSIREYNNKKLKYLLSKQKQINQFFKNLVIKKDNSSERYQIQYKMKEKPLKISTNESMVQKTKIVNTGQYQIFEKQFEDKRKLQQFKYDNVELESMLTQILTNFENCITSNKATKKIAVISKQYAQTSKQKLSLPKQSIKQSKYSPTNNPQSSQCQRRIQPQHRILKTEKSCRNLKSDRSAQGFRIKHANKEPKEIRQQKEEQLCNEQPEEFPRIQIKQSFKRQKPHQIVSNSPSEKTANIFQLPELSQIKKPEQQQHDPLEFFVKPKQSQNSEKMIITPQQQLPATSQLCQPSSPSSNDQKLVIQSPKLVQQSSKQKQSIEISQNRNDRELQSDNKIQKQQQNQQKQQEALKKPQIQVNQEIHAKQQQEVINQPEKVANQQLIIENQQKQLKPLQQSQKSIASSVQQEQSVEQKKSVQLSESAKQISEKSNYPNNNQKAEAKELPSKPPSAKIIQECHHQETINKQEIQQLPKVQPENTPPAPEEISAVPQVAYDPLASTFQLTGFNKSSLSKFRDLKKKKTIPEIQQNISMFGRIPAKKPTKSNQAQLSTEFDQQLKEGQNLEKDSEFEKAFLLYTKMYKTYKKENEKQIVLIRIGSLFERQQKFAEAEKTYLKCTKFNNVEAFLKLGSLLLKNGRINSGVENIQKANCIKRSDLEIENKLVYGYSLKEQTMEKALTLAQMILKKEPESLETLIITANILQKQGKIREAIEIVTAVDKFKEAEYIKHYLGILYLQDSNLTEAFNHFKAALAIQPDYLPSLIEVATIISEISPKQSISILKKVLEIEPYNRKALARLGKIYESIENDFQSAMVAYQTALQTQENYESYIKIGDCLAKQQSYIEALINYKQALNLRKTHQAYAKVANMFDKKEEFLKAIENYELALQFLSKQKEGNIAKRKQYLLYLGNLSIKVGNYESGIKFFEDIEDHQDSLDILKLLGEAYFGKKQYEMALQRFEKANKITNGENIQILQKIAICFDKMEEYLASKTIYQKILEKDPENIRCMNNLANILLIIGETNQSFYLFESMLQKAPKNLEKRLKVADIYAQVGDWSKVQFHLLQCIKQKENDERVMERLVNLYKEKRDFKMANKYEKKLNMLKNSRKGQSKNISN